MMKRIIIVCEGPTEKEFCQDILLPHFQKLNIVIEAPLIKQSGGGIVPWRILKSQLERHLAEGDAVVTTFIDYYGIRKDHEFPGWEASQKAPHNIDKVLALEEAMSNEFANPEDINNSPKTAPSKRILGAVKSYSKVLDGNCVAMDIGLERMRQCCPHFNEWVSEMEKVKEIFSLYVSI